MDILPDEIARPYLDWERAWHDSLYAGAGFFVNCGPTHEHFATAVSGIDGGVHLLAAHLTRIALDRGYSSVVDVGAGQGDLLAAMTTFPGRRIAVEVRPPRMPCPGIEWHRAPGGAALPSSLRGLRGALVIAHEWLDNVPAPVVQLAGDGVPRRILVNRSGQERLGQEVSGEQADWLTAWWPLDRPGQRAEVGLPRDRAWSDLLGHTRESLVVAVDYGHLRSSRPVYGSLRAYCGGRQAAALPDGSRDLTASVAVDSLVAHRRRRQSEVLTRTGGDILCDDVRDRRHSSALSGLAARSAYRSLIDPVLFGDYWWVEAET